jgi:hypothetical protein
VSLLPDHSSRTLAAPVARNLYGREPWTVGRDDRVCEAVEVGGAAVEVPAHQQALVCEVDLRVGRGEVRELVGASRGGRSDQRSRRPPRSLWRASGPADERGAVELAVLGDRQPAAVVQTRHRRVVERWSREDGRGLRRVAAPASIAPELPPPGQVAGADACEVGRGTGGVVAPEEIEPSAVGPPSRRGRRIRPSAAAALLCWRRTPGAMLPSGARAPVQVSPNNHNTLPSRRSTYAGRSAVIQPSGRWVVIKLKKPGVSGRWRAHGRGSAATARPRPRLPGLRVDARPGCLRHKHPQSSAPALRHRALLSAAPWQIGSSSSNAATGCGS